jgi:hypothetical protein
MAYRNAIAAADRDTAAHFAAAGEYGDAIADRDGYARASGDGHSYLNANGNSDTNPALNT